VIVPLLILYAKRPVCRLKPEEGVRELFKEAPEGLRRLDGFSAGNICKNFFIFLDRGLKRIDGLIPRSSREKAIQRAHRWMIDHMQGNGGVGAIFPAMANSVMALKALGFSNDHPDIKKGIQALDDLLIAGREEAICQPCLSPVWDTCLSLIALLETGVSPKHPAINTAVDWLIEQQVLVPGDWRYRAPTLEPGGWAFEFENTYYPDLDDTPVVLMGLLRAGAHLDRRYVERIAKGVNWIIGMQSKDGGWGAFDIDNNALYLNHIPFADHGALLDPSTSDVTARCMELLSMIGYTRNFPPITRALDFIRKEQESNGAWFGRWGVNYIYGTWSVLAGLKQIGEDMSQPYIRKAVNWLISCQNSDGGWGETCYSYHEPAFSGRGETTASQTAWALLGLMAAGEVDSGVVRRGIEYLCGTQNETGGWEERQYTGTGFPKVFYLRYHGYRQFFPMWALGVYRSLLTAGSTRQDKMRLKSPISLNLTNNRSS
jgi:squalene-hopene/tetraprenyl-beta-curcumene cyclase